MDSNRMYYVARDLTNYVWFLVHLLVKQIGIVCSILHTIRIEREYSVQL